MVSVDCRLGLDHRLLVGFCHMIGNPRSSSLQSGYKNQELALAGAILLRSLYETEALISSDNQLGLSKRSS